MVWDGTRSPILGHLAVGGGGGGGRCCGFPHLLCCLYVYLPALFCTLCEPCPALASVRLINVVPLRGGCPPHPGCSQGGGRRGGAVAASWLAAAGVVAMGSCVEAAVASAVGFSWSWLGSPEKGVGGVVSHALCGSDGGSSASAGVGVWSAASSSCSTSHALGGEVALLLLACGCAVEAWFWFCWWSEYCTVDD